MEQLNKESFDLIFIDAEKSGYITYFKEVLDYNLLKVGGLLIFDNST